MQIQLEGLTKHYGAQAALKGLTFATVGEPSALVLIGPSGGGKSTLLRILGGLETPTKGTALINESKIEPMTPEPELRRWRGGNGYLFQSFNLFPHLTALRNVSLPLVKVHGMTEAAARERALECLERFSLGDHAGKRPSELSGGQQQRVGIARAIAHKPRLLLLDEPTSALDPEMTAEVLEVIQQLQEAGQEFILSTHEMGFARAVADHVLFLAEGEIREESCAEGLFSHPHSELTKRFLSKVMKYA